MCTVVILRRPNTPWPILLGANRDEMLARPWHPPARHWPDRPDVVAGLDDLAGGSWMGINDDGVVACILNRHGTLGPTPDKRSRGELVLEALDHADAREAAQALARIDPNAYRPFNLVIADNRDAWWLALTAIGQETGAGVRVEPIPEGLSMFTAGDRNDPHEPRIAAHLPRFMAAPAPAPETGSWEGWQTLLGAGTPVNADPVAAMSFRTETGYGTSSSSLVALPSVAASHGQNRKRPIWLFAAGQPESAPFLPIKL
ncbi:MAG: hypothetical protein EPO08_00350 [Rhodospirillaceae bacterium]|nr:MAG: hypothetical protein EPO08_00350 [Rhodospirillaceae bacterium]